SRALSRANLQAVPGVTDGASGGNGAAGLEEATSGAASGDASAGVEVGLPDDPGGPAPAAGGLQEAHQDFVGLDVAKLPSEQAGAQLGHATFGRLAGVQPAQGQSSGTTADAVDQQTGTTGGGVDAGAAVVPEGAAGNHVLVEAVLKDPNITL